MSLSSQVASLHFVVSTSGPSDNSVMSSVAAIWIAGAPTASNFGRHASFWCVGSGRVWTVREAFAIARSNAIIRCLPASTAATPKAAESAEFFRVNAARVSSYV